MRQLEKDRDSSVRAQASGRSVAEIIGARCEICDAYVWPLTAACSRCETATRRPRTFSALEADAARPCEWPRDMPTFERCPCMPCLARRVLASDAAEVTP